MATGQMTPLFVDLDVWALGNIVSRYFGPGTGLITFQVLNVRIPSIKPEGLESVIDCLIRQMLNALLENVQLPFHVLSAGVFQLILEQGPTIDQDQVEVWGDITEESCRTSLQQPIKPRQRLCFTTQKLRWAHSARAEEEAWAPSWRTTAQAFRFPVAVSGTWSAEHYPVGGLQRKLLAEFLVRYRSERLSTQFLFAPNLHFRLVHAEDLYLVADSDDSDFVRRHTDDYGRFHGIGGPGGPNWIVSITIQSAGARSAIWSGNGGLAGSNRGSGDRGGDLDPIHRTFLAGLADLVIAPLASPDSRLARRHHYAIHLGADLHTASAPAKMLVLPAGGLTDPEVDVTITALGAAVQASDKNELVLSAQHRVGGFSCIHSTAVR